MQRLKLSVVSSWNDGPSKVTRVRSDARHHIDIMCFHDYHETVKPRSQRYPPKLRRPGLLEEQVFVNLMLTVDHLARRLELVLKAAEISPVQYNVLRILRGAPQGLSCGEIGRDRKS